MPELIALSKSAHKNFRVKPNVSYSFCKDDNLCPVILQELHKVLVQGPIVFAKDPNSNFTLCALQSVQDKRNYFVNKNGEWKTTYIPARYRIHPFHLIKNNENKQVICFEKNHPQIGENLTEGVDFFDRSGEPTQYLKNLIQFLTAYHENRDLTQKAIKTLNNMELIVPLTLRVKKDDKESNTTGLWKVEKEKFATLPSDSLKILADNHALEIIYAHFFSINNFEDLVNLADVEKKELGQKKLNLTEKAKKKQKDAQDIELNNLVQNLLSNNE